MTNDRAVDILRNAAWLGTHDEREQIEEAIDMAINALTAQADSKETSSTHKALDTISRQDAIRVASGFCHPANIAKELAKLPSAQPEIVLCKDCIFHGLCRTSPKWAVAPKDDWFCADAERRTDE